MRSRVSSYHAVVVLWIAMSCPVVGQELRDTLQDLEVSQRWAYNDWDSAQNAAAISKKPILALFR